MLSNASSSEDPPRRKESRLFMLVRDPSRSLSWAVLRDPSFPSGWQSEGFSMTTIIAGALVFLYGIN